MEKEGGGALFFAKIDIITLNQSINKSGGFKGDVHSIKLPK